MKRRMAVLLCLNLVVGLLCAPALVEARQFRKADINRDGVVDIFDVSILIAHWRQHYPKADLNKDGIVDIVDVSIMMSEWSGY